MPAPAKTEFVTNRRSVAVGTSMLFPNMYKPICIFALVGSLLVAAQDSSHANRAKPSTPAVGAACRLNAADEREVAAIPDRYRDAWFAPDASTSVMQLFIEDSTLLPAHGTAPVQGKKNITAWWWPPNSRPFELLEFTMTPQRTSGCGQVAQVSGLQTLKWKYKDENKTTYQAGTFLMVFRKQPDGRWLIDSFMWDDQPYVAK